MELIAGLFIVMFFVILNEVRVAFTGEDNPFSELLIVLSSLVAGFLFSLVAGA